MEPPARAEGPPRRAGSAELDPAHPPEPPTVRPGQPPAVHLWATLLAAGLFLAVLTSGARYARHLPAAGRPPARRSADWHNRMNLLARIDRWASETPARPAFVQGDRTLTYGELIGRSRRLAQHLVAALPDDRAPVAIVGHKEPELLVA